MAQSTKLFNSPVPGLPVFWENPSTQPCRTWEQWDQILQPALHAKEGLNFRQLLGPTPITTLPPEQPGESETQAIMNNRVARNNKASTEWENECRRIAAKGYQINNIPWKDAKGEDDVGRVVRRTNDRVNPVQKKFGLFHPVSEKVVVKHKVAMEEVVTNLRAMQQNSNIFACATENAEEVYLFNYATNIQCSQKFSPDIVLKHTKWESSFSITGIDWNPGKAGDIISCTDAGFISLHEVNKSTHPVSVFTLEGSKFSDVKWHRSESTVFATCSDDGSFHIWDTRSRDKTGPSHTVSAHKDATTCLSFSSVDDSLMMSSSKDRTLALWDLRNLSVKIHSFTDHSNPVEKVSWSPHDGNFVASSDDDRTLMLWDLSKIGSLDQSALNQQSSTEDALYHSHQSPELIFVHGGHSAKVTDFAWNPNHAYLIGSAAEDNISQFWVPCEPIVPSVF